MPNIHVHVVGDKPPRIRPRDTRRIALVLRIARHAHLLSIHADRDRCMPALIQATIATRIARDMLPPRIRDDWHDRVVMPATRTALRIPDALPDHTPDH